MLTGLHEFNGQKMFFTTNGALRSNGTPSSWKKASGNWYYYDENGIPSLGKKNINGSIYCCNQEGVMQTGWVSVNGQWNYYAVSGALQTGWIKDKEIWYYLDKDGIMLTGNQVISGIRYYLNTSGAMQTGWKQLDGNWYYFQADGSLLKNETTPDDYKVNEEGVWKQVVTVDKKPNQSTNKQKTATLTDKSDKMNQEEKQENHKEMNSFNPEKQKEDSIIESSISNKKE